MDNWESLFPKDVNDLSLDELKKLYLDCRKQFLFREAEMERTKDDINFYREAIENIPNAIIIKDSTGNIVVCSKKFGDTFGSYTNDIFGRTTLELHECFADDDRIKFHDDDQNILYGPGDLESRSIEEEVELRYVDGKIHPNLYWSKGFVVEDSKADPMGIVSEFVDMTKEKEMEAELFEASRTDQGTKLFNRYVFNDVTKSIIESARDNSTPVSVLMCDLDHFKRVNDTFGHLEGDNILMRFAEIIKSQIRDGVDVPIRYGGEEFLIFLNDTDLDVAQIVAERIRKTTEETLNLPDGSFLTVSIGVVKFNPAETRTQCINRADEALYTAKSTGRNKVVIDNGINVGQVMGHERD